MSSDKIIELVKKLMAAIDQTDVTELSYEEGGVKISLRRGSPPSAQLMAPPVMQMMTHTPHQPPAVTGPKEIAPAGAGKTEARPSNYIPVKSPFVGTFYRSPAPNSPMFTDQGKEVRPGDVLCIVEAMKLMNEIESEVHARVARILVENGQPVEYGQELFLLEPLS